MGTFLAASGVIGMNDASVVNTIGSFATARDGTFEPMAGTPDDRHIAVISDGSANCTVLYPQDFIGWDEISQHLSQRLQTPVFSFHIHDGDLWMFQLFNKGDLVTRHNPLPDYWGELDPTERSSWEGNAEAISACIPFVSADSIRKYFVTWSDELMGLGQKAYPDDEFEYGVDWQLIDFMRRFGLEYPIRNDGTLAGRTYRLRIRRARP